MSKVKVEDLISNKEPEAPKKGRVPDDESISKVSDQSLWDRPVSSPPFDWAFDPRMPQEWNELVASICASKRWSWVLRTEAYWQATNNEILATEEVWLDRNSVSMRAKTAATVQLAILNDSKE